MVINIRLADVHTIEPGVESMGRSWYGYEPSLTDLELWEQNRGRYAFGQERIEAERFATLSYRGEVMVVAALRDPIWEPFEDFERGIMKKALIGDVLGPGDPVWEALRGQTVAPGRSAFVYLPDDEWGLAGSGTTPAAGAPGERSSTQGWQSDPVRRKQVEDAAQDRLMAHYRDRGWTVRDTRFTRPFDAVAERGDEIVYLEAKGTQTAGAAVLVTVGEVEHARRHPGRCVMGVLSDIRLDADGQVDPGSGTFRVLPFEPEEEALEITGYQWRLPGEQPYAQPEIRPERGTIRS